MKSPVENCQAFKKKLNPKQQKFVLEYLKDYNATRAALKAGYSEKTACKTGSENLSKPDIQKALAEVSEIIQSKDIADAVELREFWTKVLRGDIGEVCSWNDGGLSFNSTSEGMQREARRLIKRISVKEKTSPKGDFTEVQTTVELHDPLKASELLGRSLGIFIEKTELSGGVKLLTNVPE